MLWVEWWKEEVEAEALDKAVWTSGGIPCGNGAHAARDRGAT